MNYIYKMYLEILSEKGYLELEEFIEILKNQINEFFDIAYQNILDSIYAKSQELTITDEEIEQIAQREYERIEILRKKIFNLPI
ncbi:MAG: hypothetical protein ABIL37_00345 [candidate division WOR-3 bacterium]